MITNKCPDGESAVQPGSAAKAIAARKAGLGYADIPVTGATISMANDCHFQAAVNAAEDPGAVNLLVHHGFDRAGEHR